VGNGRRRRRLWCQVWTQSCNTRDFIEALPKEFMSVL
jgi:hypothetical protein